MDNASDVPPRYVFRYGDAYAPFSQSAGGVMIASHSIITTYHLAMGLQCPARGVCRWAGLGPNFSTAWWLLRAQPPRAAGRPGALVGRSRGDLTRQEAVCLVTLVDLIGQLLGWAPCRLSERQRDLRANVPREQSQQGLRW